jgi:hypothetical protein
VLAFNKENVMTISTRTLGCLLAATTLALFAPVSSAWAGPEADGVSEDDIDVDVDEDDDDDDDDEADDCDSENDDCDSEGHVTGGCSGTIAPELGQSIGGLLCTLGLLGWQLRRRRAA